MDKSFNKQLNNISKSIETNIKIKPLTFYGLVQKSQLLVNMCWHKWLCDVHELHEDKVFNGKRQWVGILVFAA